MTLELTDLWRIHAKTETTEVVLQVTGKMSEFPKAIGDNQGTLGISKMTEWNVAPTPSPKWIQ